MDGLGKLKDQITPHVNFSQRKMKEKLKCKGERTARSELEIELGMCVCVGECTYLCMCV